MKLLELDYNKKKIHSFTTIIDNILCINKYLKKIKSFENK